MRPTPNRGCIAVVAAAGLAVILYPLMAAEAAAPAPAAFSRCAGCHSTRPGENKIGPSLAGVFGRSSGSVAGYHYSAALANAKLVWDDKTLDQYLQNPNGFVHGTKMFVSIPDAQIREQLITYLKTLQPQAAGN
jgi:cytochrome c